MPLRVWALADRWVEGDLPASRALLRSVALREGSLGNVTLPDQWDIIDIRWDGNHWEAFIRNRIAIVGTVHPGASRAE